MEQKNRPRRNGIDACKKIYNVGSWGKSYYDIDVNGDVVAQAPGNAGTGVVLRKVVEELKQQRVLPPYYFVFPGIIGESIDKINRAFQKAIQKNNYPGNYRYIYPVKVNQDYDVVKPIIECGLKYGSGIEVGSKTEFLAVAPLLDRYDFPIICNGYKGPRWLELITALAAKGKTIYVVIEKLKELEELVKLIRKYGAGPRLGLRLKPFTQSVGRWKVSSGDRSKFGLCASELIMAVDMLRKEDMLDRLSLLHVHIGSQISQISALETVLKEVAHVYVSLYRMGAPLEQLDIGGGLAVDYVGTTGFFDYSRNYNLAQYATVVVRTLAEICGGNGVACPNLFTESGRYVSAYSSVLVFDIVDSVSMVAPFSYARKSLEEIKKITSRRDIHRLFTFRKQINRENYIRYYHQCKDIVQAIREAFRDGKITLLERALAENCYGLIYRKVTTFMKRGDIPPHEQVEMERWMSDFYYGNFSIFQSLPDSWVLEQTFPVMPIHRLDTLPTRKGVIADLTCDSDGTIKHYVNKKNLSNVIPLHPLEEGKDYYIGVFLAGAYQRVLGNYHNLFGKINQVSIRFDEDEEKGYVIDNIRPADTTAQVLLDTHYNIKQSITAFKAMIGYKDAENESIEKENPDDAAGIILELYKELLVGDTYLHGHTAACEQPVTEQIKKNSNHMEENKHGINHFRSA